MKTYTVPAGSIEVEYEIKKSRFIARAACAQSREAALSVIARARRDFPDARHHCFAYLIGNPHSVASAAANDDGEPAGTAGKPILNVLQHKEVGDVVVVVTRYFGGIKLGAGGLVRAYSAAAQMAMEALPLVQHQRQADIEVELDFSREQSLRHWLDVHRGAVLEARYGQGVSIRLQFADIYREKFMAFAAAQGMQIIQPRPINCQSRENSQ